MEQSFPKRDQLPNGTRQGQNSFRKIGYNGPCPPPGKTHRYFFRFYAMDSKLELPAGATRAELDTALKGMCWRTPSTLAPIAARPGCGEAPIGRSVPALLN